MSASHLLGHIAIHAAKNPTVQAAAASAGSAAIGAVGTAMYAVGTAVIATAPVTIPLALGYGLYKLLK